MLTSNDNFLPTILLLSSHVLEASNDASAESGLRYVGLSLNILSIACLFVCGVGQCLPAAVVAPGAPSWATMRLTLQGGRCLVRSLLWWVFAYSLASVACHINCTTRSCNFRENEPFFYAGNFCRMMTGTYGAGMSFFALKFMFLCLPSNVCFARRKCLP